MKRGNGLLASIVCGVRSGFYTPTPLHDIVFQLSSGIREMCIVLRRQIGSVYVGSEIVGRELSIFRG